MFNNNELCEATDEAVKNFTADILAAASSYEDYGGELDVTFEMCLNANETLEAASATIISDLGIVVVFPDFKRKSAKAAVVNLGAINYMQQEGFDEAFIEKEGRIYGKLLSNNQSNANVFGYYLTHKIDQSSQQETVEDSED